MSTKENRGALFKNNKREKDTHPHYNGSINVGGKDYWLSAWMEKSKAGQTYMSVSVKQKDGEAPPFRPGQPATRAPAPAARAPQQMYDDDVPF